MKVSFVTWVGRVSALAAAVSIAGILWMIIYRFTNSQQSTNITLLLVVCLLVQLAGWVGIRFFKKQHIWPGVCMLLAAAGALYAGTAGPGTILGFSYGIIGEMLAGYISQPIYYLALPGMICGMLSGAALLVLGLLWLCTDVMELTGKTPKEDATKENEYTSPEEKHKIAELVKESIEAAVEEPQKEEKEEVLAENSLEERPEESTIENTVKNKEKPPKKFVLFKKAKTFVVKLFSKLKVEDDD